MEKAYSFDVWLTLIKSNPSFKRKRAELFLSDGLDISAISDLISRIDSGMNNLSRVKGVQPTLDTVIFCILDSLRLDTSKIDEYVQKMQNLFLEYPPEFYCSETVPVLRELKSSGAELFITSNTFFVKGATIRKFFDDQGILDLFSKTTFSDESRYCKPCYRFFEESVGNPIVPVKDILHVGDDLISDGQGALNFGMKFYQINSNSNRITDLLK